MESTASSDFCSRQQRRPPTLSLHRYALLCMQDTLTSRERKLHSQENVLTELHRRLADEQMKYSGEVEHSSGLAAETHQVRHVSRGSDVLLVYRRTALDFRGIAGPEASYCWV